MYTADEDSQAVGINRTIRHEGGLVRRREHGPICRGDRCVGKTEC